MSIPSRILFTDPTGSFDSTDESLKEGLLNLIRKARHTISIHGFSLAGFHQGELFDADIVSRLKRGVELSVFGNNESEVRLIASVFSQYELRCHYWAAPPPAIYHVKAIVVDERYAYVGSANMSRNALERNSEVGLFLEDNRLATEISRYSAHLVDQGYMLEV